MVTNDEFAATVIAHVDANPGHSVVWQCEHDPMTAECLNCRWTNSEPDNGELP